MLLQNNSCLVIIDVQDKLLPAMSEHEALVDNLCRLVRAATVLELPIVYTEQYPQGLGATSPLLRALLPGAPLTKNAFSCCADADFNKVLSRQGCNQILVAGIEAHVCVCQTVLELLDNGYEVFVVADAIASRSPENRRLAINRMAAASAKIVSVEMAVFEMLREARGPAFKAILDIIK